MDISNPRRAGREAVRLSVPPDLWQANELFARQLLEQVEAHPIHQHPIIRELENGTPDLAAQRTFHLEFRHAFAQIFTDVVINAMATASQLEERLGAPGKVSARFLLQLNLLDELGFQPQPTPSDYAGNPQLAHYAQFHLLLEQLGVGAKELGEFSPSRAADACRRTFTNYYCDHCLLTCVLAISETVFKKFAGPWATSVRARAGAAGAEGYHNIHIEHDGEFLDDDHSEDAWYVFRQALTRDRYAELITKSQVWLDTWAGFLDHLMHAADPQAAVSSQAGSRFRRSGN
jgi:hypothetical protein